jgi:hypothetical protein
MKQIKQKTHGFGSMGFPFYTYYQKSGIMKHPPHSSCVEIKIKAKKIEDKACFHSFLFLLYNMVP